MANVDRLGVAVWMITYNHEKYIGEAIDGVMNQKTDFPVMLFIGEDCSLDNTRAICIDYAKRYPDRITLILNEQNNLVRNGTNIYDACFESGLRYMAMCEGDDFWSDPAKLQMQVDFLENNPDFVSCYHNTIEQIDEDPTKSFLYCPPDRPATCSTVDLLTNGNLVPTCSNVYRRKHLPAQTDWIHRLGIGDWALNIRLSKVGHIGYLNRVMGVHRIHGTGIWSKISAVQKELFVLRAYEAFLKHLNPNNAERKVIKQRIHALIRAICAVYVQAGHRGKALKFLLKHSSKHPEFFFRIYFLQCFKLLLLGASDLTQ
jgi:glycosyltransferase involved in cell wall biosynthesis